MDKTIIDVKMLADLVDQSIVPTKYKVILADGSPVDVLGIKQCQIQLGNYVVNMEVLVTKNLYENCLLGFDFLNMCPATKGYINGLQDVLNRSSLTNENGCNGGKEKFSVDYETIGNLGFLMNSFDSETLKSDSVNNGGKVVDSDEEIMVCQLSANKEYDHSL